MKADDIMNICTLLKAVECEGTIHAMFKSRRKPGNGELEGELKIHRVEPTTKFKVTEMFSIYFHTSNSPGGHWIKELFLYALLGIKKKEENVLSNKIRIYVKRAINKLS